MSPQRRENNVRADEDYCPTDGYFSSRQHSKDMHTESSTSSNNDMKTREAARPSSPSPQSPHFASHNPETPPSSETTPLLESSPPPPAYSDTMAGTYQAPMTQSFSPGQYGEGSGGKAAVYFFDGPRDLEDMGGLPPDHNAGIVRRRSSRRYSRGRVFLILAGHAIVAWLIIMAIRGHRGHKHSGLPPPKKPSLDIPDLPAHCNADRLYHTRNSVFDFDDPTSFRLQEVIQENEPSHAVSGVVSLVTAPTDQKTKISVNLTISSSENYSSEHIYAEKSDFDLIIRSAHSRPTLRSMYHRPCTVIHAVVYIIPGTSLDELELASKHLSVNVYSDLDTTVDNATSIRLATGSLSSSSSASLSSRRTHIDLTTGSVQGSYALYDLLSITTHSGSIFVSVDPKDADKEHPEPATFTARSNTGSIKALFPTTELPAREYRTAVHTDVGSVDGTYIHGISTILTSNAGSISAELLPYAADDDASTLRTGSRSGHTQVQLLAPYNDPAGKIKRLTSEHTSLTGSVTVRYPDGWVGGIFAESVTGSLHVGGKDVEVVGEGSRGPVGKWIEAKKGEGDSKLNVKGVSGSVEVEVGGV